MDSIQKISRRLLGQVLFILGRCEISMNMMLILIDLFKAVSNGQNKDSGRSLSPPPLSEMKAHELQYETK